MVMDRKVMNMRFNVGKNVDVVEDIYVVVVRKVILLIIIMILVV